MAYLGHVISTQGVATNKEKVAAMLDYSLAITSEFEGVAWVFRSHGLLSKVCGQLLEDCFTPNCRAQEG